MSLDDGIRFFAATDVGRVRSHNEDNFLIDRRLGLFVVADGMGGHAAGEVASRLAIESLQDPTTKALVLEVLADTGQAAFAVQRVTETIAAEPAVAGRLALWGRRLVGEAIIQAQRVAVERDAITELLVGAGDLAGIVRLLNRLTDNHTRRMAALGLSA